VKIRVDVLRDAAALQGIASHWEALAAQAAEPNPFYEPWMLLPALEAYGTPAGFRCAAVWIDGRLEALFPLALERRFRGLPVGAARSYLHRNMLVGTPLVRLRTAAASIGALLDSGVAPLVQFDWCSADGAFYGALAEAANDARFPWVVSDAYTRAILVRGRDPRPRFNSNMKNNVRRWQAKLEAHGSLRAVRLGVTDDVIAWLEQFMQLEASGWKGKAGSALACREDDRRFVAAVFPEAFRRGRLIITGLDLGGRPLARHTLFASGEGAFTFKIAYDESYASASPGILAEVHNVGQLLESSGPLWFDSNTARESVSYGRVWKDRRTVHCVAVGLRGAGKLAVAALPLMRVAKNFLRASKTDAPAPGAGRPSLAGGGAR
jgi:CelD/BcsL family acetyltransferase involved in cellulose biosynthesis